jgi:hypothetical protein
VFGVIAPVDASNVKPAGDTLYVPNVYAPVPASTTACKAVVEVQKFADEYEIDAVGAKVMVILVVDVTAEHPFASGIV